MAKIKTFKEVPNTKLDEALATEIFNLINAFANYGFNRSHAAAYAVIGFQTAYLKAHHPAEFYAASMNLDLSNIEKLAQFAKEMRRAGAAFSGPDVNKSQARFSVDSTNDKKIVRWALSGIKGVGEQAMNHVITERQAGGAYKSFHDFVRRTAGNHLNKKAYENLIKAGALDSLHKNRAEMLFNLTPVLAGATADAKSKNSNQVSLFDFVPPPATTDRMSAVPENPRTAVLQAEFDVLGMYLSGHPIESAEDKLRRRRGRATLKQVFDPSWKAPTGRDKAYIGALLTDVFIRTTKKGEPMARLTLSDPTGTSEAVIFPRALAACRSLLNVGEAFVFGCTIEQVKDDAGELTGERKIVVETVEALRLDDNLQAA